MVIFRKFPEISGNFGNFRGTPPPEKWSFLTKFRPNFAPKILDSSLKHPRDPRGDPPGNSGENFREFREFPEISGGTLFPEIPGIFSGTLPFWGKNPRILGGVILVSSRETHKTPRFFPGISGNFGNFRKFSRGSPENPRGKFFRKFPPGEKKFRKIRGIFSGEMFFQKMWETFFSGKLKVFL